MRDIKFRAWVTGNTFFDEGKPYMVTQGEPDVETFKSFMFHYSDEKILMQYTGLKDKNGKEIYEGDIVETSDGDKRQVMYSFNSFEMRCLNGDRDSTHTTWYFTVEVLGNIYENPELLNSDKGVQGCDTSKAK